MQIQSLLQNDSTWNACCWSEKNLICKHCRLFDTCVNDCLERPNTVIVSHHLAGCRLSVMEVLVLNGEFVIQESRGQWCSHISSHAKDSIYMICTWTFVYKDLPVTQKVAFLYCEVREHFFVWMIFFFFIVCWINCCLSTFFFKDN